MKQSLKKKPIKTEQARTLLFSSLENEQTF